MYGQQHGHCEHGGPRPIFGGRPHGFGGRDRRPEPEGNPHHAFGMGGLRDVATDLLGAFADAAGGGGVDFGDMRGWHGGRHDGHDRHGFPFRRGRGRAERPFEQGDLRWLVLDLIAAQPRHGYEIIKAIEDMMNGHYAPSPGVIYPTLTYLDETGLIASEAQATKKLYTITDEGIAALEANAAAVEAVRDRIDEARERFGGPPAPEMMRAMDNLRAAIQVRLAKGTLTAQSVATITAALDRAAGEIERS